MAAFWKFHSAVQMERAVKIHHSQAEFIFQINYRETYREWGASWWHQASEQGTYREGGPPVFTENLSTLCTVLRNGLLRPAQQVGIESGQLHSLGKRN